MPFGELAWDHARRRLGREATEEQIADRVAALLRRANHGPDSREQPEISRGDRRVAARTRAAAPPEGRKGQPEPSGPPQPDAILDQAESGTPLAKVIPMPIFDPFAEADKPW